MDPVFLNTRREAILILSIWTAALIYTVAYCYRYGYLSHDPNPNSTGPAIEVLVAPVAGNPRDPSTLTMPLGFPDWVLWGIVAPWVVCFVLTFIFCLFVLKEDDLESGAVEEPSTEGGDG